MGSERPAIDWLVLDESTAGDARLAQELLSLYANVARTTSVLLLAPNHATADAAHKIRGAASAVGAQEVAEAAREAEATLRRIPTDAGRSDLVCRRLHAAIERSLEAVRAGRRE